jgi:natural product precursor
MKKLSKIKLQNAVALEEQEMKRIYGGSGSGGSGSSGGSGGSGGNVSCTTSCGSGFTTVGPDYFDTSAEWASYLFEMNELLCGSTGAVTCSGEEMEFNF